MAFQATSLESSKANLAKCHAKSNGIAQTVILGASTVQSGASYLSQGFVMVFHVSCEGLPGQ